MAHFPKHLPVQWELFRNEPLKAQIRREAQRHQIEEIDKGRGQSDGLWWPDQRYVDVVVPAEYVNPDSIDTFNYRYQVYARPPPVQCEPQTIAEASDGALPTPLRYNIKRIAQCKPVDWNPPQCWAHWERHPFTLTRDSDQGGDFELQRQSKNNNSCVERPDVVHAKENPPSPASQQSSCAVQPPRMPNAQESKPWTSDAPIERHAPRKTPVRLSPIGQNTNKNRGFKKIDYFGRFETNTESPRSSCSCSSSCASGSSNRPTTVSKTGTDLRGEAVKNIISERHSPKRDIVSSAGIACKESNNKLEYHLVGQGNEQETILSTKMDAVCPLGSEHVTAEDNGDKQGRDSQASTGGQKTNVSATHSFLKSVLSLDNLKMETPRSESANDANNNERNRFGNSSESLNLSVKGGKFFEEDMPADRSTSRVSEQSGACGDRIVALPEVLSTSNEHTQIRSDTAMLACNLANRGQTSMDQVRRGKRFGYSTEASKDSVCSLLVGGPARSNIPHSLSPIQPKPSQSMGFPLTDATCSETYITPTEIDSAYRVGVKKGGKRTGYQAKAVKDSVIFGGSGNSKGHGLSLHGGGKRSCQTGGYRSLANSDNMKSLIFPENVNGNNSQNRPSDEKDGRVFKYGNTREHAIKIDQFVFDEGSTKEFATDSSCSDTTNSDLHTLPFCFAASLCTNNNSAISDPILGIQLDRSCQLPNEHHLRPPNRGENNRLDASGRKRSEIPYDTYKIVGGLQYRACPPEDLLSELRLPPHLAEYQEFTRRCPNYKVGRYDRSDPANEMLLPSNKTMHTLRMTLDPFMYARNPKADKFSPLFYTTAGYSELKWPMPVSKKDKGIKKSN